MYYYFYVTLRGGRPWWRVWVTRLQIVQFVLDVAVCAIASYRLLLNGPLMAQGGCWGTPLGAVTGVAILSSYLVLFLRFYAQNYVRRREGKAKAKAQ